MSVIVQVIVSVPLIYACDYRQLHNPTSAQACIQENFGSASMLYLSLPSVVLFCLDNLHNAPHFCKNVKIHLYNAAHVEPENQNFPLFGGPIVVIFSEFC